MRNFWLVIFLLAFSTLVFSDDHKPQAKPQQQAKTRPQQAKPQHSTRAPEHVRPTHSTRAPEHVNRGHDREVHGRYRGPAFHSFHANRWNGPRYAHGSRFWFGGYWFLMGGPVPVCWVDSDEVVVIQENEEYFLFNRRCNARVVVVVQ